MNPVFDANKNMYGAITALRLYYTCKISKRVLDDWESGDEVEIEDGGGGKVSKEGFKDGGGKQVGPSPSIVISSKPSSGSRSPNHAVQFDIPGETNDQSGIDALETQDEFISSSSLSDDEDDVLSPADEEAFFKLAQDRKGVHRESEIVQGRAMSLAEQREIELEQEERERLRFVFGEIEEEEVAAPIPTPTTAPVKSPQLGRKLSLVAATPVKSPRMERKMSLVGSAPEAERRQSLVDATVARSSPKLGHVAESPSESRRRPSDIVPSDDSDASSSDDDYKEGIKSEKVPIERSNVHKPREAQVADPIIHEAKEEEDIYDEKKAVQRVLSRKESFKKRGKPVIKPEAADAFLKNLATAIDDANADIPEPVPLSSPMAKREIGKPVELEPTVSLSSPAPRTSIRKAPPPPPPSRDQKPTFSRENSVKKESLVSESLSLPRESTAPAPAPNSTAVTENLLEAPIQIVEELSKVLPEQKLDLPLPVASIIDTKPVAAVVVDIAPVQNDQGPEAISRKTSFRKAPPPPPSRKPSVKSTDTDTEESPISPTTKTNPKSPPPPIAAKSRAALERANSITSPVIPPKVLDSNQIIPPTTSVDINASKNEQRAPRSPPPRVAEKPSISTTIKKPAPPPKPSRASIAVAVSSRPPVQSLVEKLESSKSAAGSSRAGPVDSKQAPQAPPKKQ